MPIAETDSPQLLEPVSRATLHAPGPVSSAFTFTLGAWPMLAVLCWCICPCFLPRETKVHWAVKQCPTRSLSHKAKESSGTCVWSWKTGNAPEPNRLAINFWNHLLAGNMSQSSLSIIGQHWFCCWRHLSIYLFEVVLLLLFWCFTSTKKCKFELTSKGSLHVKQNNIFSGIRVAIITLSSTCSTSHFTQKNRLFSHLN